MDRAAANSDRNLFTAALIEAIGRAPGQVTLIIRYAHRRAPAYLPAAAGWAMQTYPGFRQVIVEAMTQTDPRSVTVAATLAQAAPAAEPAPARPESREPTARIDYAGGRSDWAVVLGLGIGLEPNYEGHDQHEVVPLPLIDIVWRNTVFVSSARTGSRSFRGVGVNIIDSPKFTLGTSISYRLGRDEDESERLEGAGDVDDAIEAGVFGEVRWKEFHARGDLRQDVIGAHDGTIIEFAGGVTGNASPKDLIVLEATGHWAGDNYMQTYFGVNAGQTNGGQRSQFATAAAFKDVGATLRWTHTPVSGAPWFGTLTLSWTRLLGDAVNSPLTDTDSENQFAAGLVVGYRF